MDLRVGPANNSPMLAVHPRQSRFVVLANRMDAPQFGCALQVSGNGGRTWLPLDPVPKLPKGAERCYAPEVAFDADGRLYFLFVGLAGRGNEPMGAFLTHSDDRGETFGPPRRVLSGFNFGVRMVLDHDAGDQGRIHLVWLKATSDPPLGGFGPPPNPIMHSFSDDQGRSFSDPVQVSDVQRARVVAPALALGGDGSVHVAYYDLGADAVDYQGLEGTTWEGTWSVVVATSRDGGRRFGPGVVVDDDVVPHERVMLIFTMPPPALAADGDRICAAWTDALHGDADVLARCSLDSGARWLEPQRLNDDPRGNGKIQYLPRLVFGDGGRLHAIFFDRREDPRNLHNDVRYTYSDDRGGERFRPSVRLTEDPSYSRIGQQYGNVSARRQFEFGARLALLPRGAGALAAWPDTRNSRPGTTNQDLFTTDVRFPSSTYQPGWARMAGAILLLVATTWMVATMRRRRRMATATPGAGGGTT